MNADYQEALSAQVRERQEASELVHRNRPSLSLSRYPTGRLPTCDVCNDLQRTIKIKYDIHADQLDSAVQRGCHSCFLISSAISTFCISLPTGLSETYSLSRLQQLDIVLGVHTTLCVCLHFRQLSGGFSSILLEIFSINRSSTWPVVSNSVGLPAKLDLATMSTKVTAWINNCNTNHAHCKIPDCPVLPARVLDIGALGDFDNVKLVLAQGTSAQYVALSYCWGKGEGMIQTTKSSISSWTQAIPWEQLPQTFQDAIKITQKLGIRYLWIDALCIIQDDVEDWEKESANMANIYSNSYITTAATAASDSHAGLFLDRWTSAEAQNAIKLPVEAHQVSTTGLATDETIFVRPRIHLAHERFINTDNAEDHAEEAPLLTRAWAFQERLLPARTLHFHAEELIWECKSEVKCECEELDRQYSYRENLMQGWLKNFVTGSLHADKSAEKLGYVWLDLVSEFGALHLTRETDRLPALSGLACEFSNKSLGTYVAGIWQHDIARGLLFETVARKRPLVMECEGLCAPS